jgi:hypothetical protein
MRHGHAPSGITLKPVTLTVWALSLYTYSRLEADLDELIENSTESEYSKHKEEGKTKLQMTPKTGNALRQNWNFV